MEIYADVVFAINFAMDTFILWVAGKLTHKRATWLRLALGGGIMAFCTCALIFLNGLQPYLNIMASVVVLMLGVVAAFRPDGLKEFAKIIGFAYISAFAIGGIGMALFYFVNMGDILGNMLSVSIKGFSLKILLASTCGFYIVFKLSYNWYKHCVIQKQVFYPVKVFYKDSNVGFTALLDTGNTLNDPVSQTPVIVAEYGAVQSFLPEGLKSAFQHQQETDLPAILAYLHEDASFCGRIRMIPFASLGKAHGLLLGFRPDKVEIQKEGNTVTLQNVIVGIYNHRLSGDGVYQGLLNPVLING